MLMPDLLYAVQKIRFSRVKFADLQDNVDLTRFCETTTKDFARMAKC